MAKCEKREIPKPPVQYVLTLSRDEAMLVRSLCWNRAALKGDTGGCIAADVASAIDGVAS